MAEQLYHIPEIHNAPDDLAAAPIDVLAEIGEVETQFVGALEDLEVSQFERLEDVENGESSELENDLSFRATTVVRVGGEALGLAMMPKEAARDLIVHESVETIAKGDNVVAIAEYQEKKKETEVPQTIYRENGLAYAQDQPDLKKWEPQASKIIDALIRGDDSLLGALPTDFANLMRVRIKSYENGVPADEREAMISVAVNGLAEKNGVGLAVEGSPEAKAQDEAWEQSQQERAA